MSNKKRLRELKIKKGEIKRKIDKIIENKTKDEINNEIAEKIADILGYDLFKVDPSHGKYIYKHRKRNKFISFDRDGHSQKVGWKLALESYRNIYHKSTREGTYDIYLDKKIKN